MVDEVDDKKYRHIFIWLCFIIPFIIYLFSFGLTGGLYIGSQITCYRNITITNGQECDKGHEFVMNIFIVLFGTLYVTIIFITQIIIEYHESKQYSKCLKFCSNHKLLGLLFTYILPLILFIIFLFFIPIIFIILAVKFEWGL